jgi:hypothetical protein
MVCTRQLVVLEMVLEMMVLEVSSMDTLVATVPRAISPL